MKKLAFLSVFCVLLADMAFSADIFIGGELTVELAGSPPDINDDAIVGPMDYTVWASALETNDEGTACLGAGISFLTVPVEGGYPEPSIGWFIYAWWQPVEQLFLKIGQIDEDQKYWVYMTLMGEELHSNNMYVHPEFSYFNGFAGHVLADSHGSFFNGLGGQKGFQMSLFPINGLTLNFGFVFAINGGLVKDQYINTLAVQAAYDIAGVGQVAVGFRNADKNAPFDPGNVYAAYAAYKELAVQWSMPIGDAMKVEAGGKYLIPPEKSDPGYAGNAPIDIGMGFGYGKPWADQFWLNTRVGVRIPRENGEDIKFGFDAVPSYDFGVFRVYVPAGIAMVLPENGDKLLAWNFSPYIKKKIGSFIVWTGFLLFNGPRSPAQELGKDNKDNINWSIPFAIEWIW